MSDKLSYLDEIKPDLNSCIIHSEVIAGKVGDFILVISSRTKFSVRLYCKHKLKKALRLIEYARCWTRISAISLLTDWKDKASKGQFDTKINKLFSNFLLDNFLQEKNELESEDPNFFKDKIILISSSETPSLERLEFLFFKLKVILISDWKEKEILLAIEKDSNIIRKYSLLEYNPIHFILRRQYEDIFSSPPKFLQEFSYRRKYKQSQIEHDLKSIKENLEPGTILRVLKLQYNETGVYLGENRVIYAQMDRCLKIRSGQIMVIESLENFLQGGKMLEAIKFFVQKFSPKELQRKAEKWAAKDHIYDPKENNADHLAFLLSTNYHYSFQDEKANNKTLKKLVLKPVLGEILT